MFEPLGVGVGLVLQVEKPFSPASHAIVVLQDLFDIFVIIPCGIEDLAHSHGAAYIVDVAAEDGDASPDGNMVKPLFPVLHTLAGALWTNQEGYLFPLFDQVHGV